MKRSDFINYLIYENGYKSYLEIGLDNPEFTFMRINCEIKESVDPYDAPTSIYNADSLPEIIKSNLTYKMTSDEMFSRMDKEKKFDIIFIDGLHTEEQVSKDIVNSLKHLNIGGKILVHDCLPKSYEAQEEEVPEVGEWNGSVWKAIPKLRELGINYYTIDSDQGVCVIDYFEGAENIDYYGASNLTYFGDFLERRNELMNVITEKEFIALEKKKHEVFFATPAIRPFNLECIGLSIKKLADTNPDFSFVWIICHDRYNSEKGIEKAYEKLFGMNIIFLGYSVEKPGQNNYGGDVMNDPIFDTFEKNWFYRLLDPWIYVLDDDNIPSERIVDVVRRVDSENPEKRFVWMRCLNGDGKIYTPYRFNAFEYESDRFPKWNPDPSMVLMKYSLFNECGGFNGGVDYDYTSFRNIAKSHFDEVLMMTDLPNGESSRWVSYDSYHNAIPFTDSIISLGNKIKEGKCYAHIFAAAKEESESDFTMIETGRISNSIALNIFKKETLEKIYNLILEEYKELKILNEEKEKHDINRFKK